MASESDSVTTSQSTATSRTAAVRDAGSPNAGSKSAGQHGDEPPRRTSRPSMADVARLAGVSSQTVSRVSNGQPNVESDTRARVIAAMRQLGYRPNGAARALKSGQFRTVGVITFTLETFGNMRTISAVAGEAAKAGYALTLIPVTDHTLQRVSGAYGRLSEAAVDGAVILFEERFVDQSRFALPPGIPIVVIGSDVASDYTVIDIDQELGVQQVTEHLLALGHRQIWHVAGPESSFAATRRASAWRRSLQAAGIEPPELLRGDWTTESGYHHGLSLGSRDDVTAIFAANDQMALGILRALHELGRRVPEEISVVGFDDMAEARSFWPPLTTVHQNFHTVGQLSMQKLLAKVDTFELPGGSDAPVDRTTVPTSLVVRDSTAPPPQR